MNDKRKETFPLKPVKEIFHSSGNKNSPSQNILVNQKFYKTSSM